KFLRQRTAGKLKDHLYLRFRRNGRNREQLETFGLKIIRSERITAIFWKTTDSNFQPNGTKIFLSFGYVPFRFVPSEKAGINDPLQIIFFGYLLKLSKFLLLNLFSDYGHFEANGKCFQTEKGQKSHCRQNCLHFRFLLYASII
uniref:Uncharacterized protein n=1 Tax=Romanomermis culicivorax TaxID=13658 RepID=A0A915HTG2_ROMCU